MNKFEENTCFIRRFPSVTGDEHVDNGPQSACAIVSDLPTAEHHEEPPGHKQ